ncbi:MAG: glycosyltransferase [Alphaproteobacteria bacterium]|nr:glycosyltransferase [Alphaproteobacteria bacterium]
MNVRPTVLHVITDLGSGGAERVLARLAVASKKFQHVIVSLTGEGDLGPSLHANGISVHALDMRPGGLPSLSAFLHLVRIIREARPVAVQTWLYHADLLGLFAARLAGCRTVAWNLRCSNMDLSRYRWSTRLVVRLLAALSPWPAFVLVNSEAGRRWHAALGYRPRHWQLTPNGIDTSLFRPDSVARDAWRRRLGIPPETVLVGMVARRDPMKDHATILAAAARAVRDSHNLEFVLAGQGITRHDPELARLADVVAAPVHLIGPCDEVPTLTAAFDIAVLSAAFGEGFPNVVAEAMATGVPCIVTDVGDAAAIVDATGLVVPPRDPEALARAISTLAADSTLRARLGTAARQRIEQHYKLSDMVSAYEELWQRLAAPA